MLRFGLIGAGNIGRFHLQWAGRHPEVTVCSVADPSLDRAQQFAKPFGAKVYADHRQMLANEKLDFVSIAVPHDKLCEVGTDSLQAGCNTLIEKPLARRIDEAAAMIAAAKAGGLKLGCVYQYRSFATPRLIKSIIDAGKIGAIRQIIWTWHELRPMAYYRQASWRSSWAGAGGGLLINQISHDIDLLRWFAGEVESVQAYLETQAHDFPLEDAVSASLRFESGALASISASSNHSRALNHRAILGTKGCIVLPDSGPLSANPDDEVLVGSYSEDSEQAIEHYPGDHQQSEIAWSTLRSKPASQRRWIPRWTKPGLRKIASMVDPGRDARQAAAAPANGHGRAVWDFANAVLKNTPIPPDIDAANGFKTLEVVNAMVASDQLQHRVALPLDPQEYAAIFDRLAASAGRDDAAGYADADV